MLGKVGICMQPADILKQDNIKTQPTRKWLGLILIALLWLAFVVNMYLVYLYHPSGAGDVEKLFGRTVAMMDGEMTTMTLPYAQGEITLVMNSLPSMILEPFARLFGWQGGLNAWYWFNVVLLLIMMWLTSKQMKRTGQRAIWWSIPIFFFPTMMTLWIGQNTIVMLAALVGAWLAYRRKQPLVTGILLAFATWLKYYPGLIILYFLFKRDWRVSGSAFISGMLILGYQVLRVGLDNFVAFITGFLSLAVTQGEPWWAYTNQSALGFAQKLFLTTPQVIPLVDSPILLTITRLSLMLVFLGTLIVLAARPAKLSEVPLRQFDFEYSLVMMVAMLLGSTLYIYGMLPALLLFAILLIHAATLRNKARWVLLAFLAVLLINLHWFLIVGVVVPPSDVELPGVLLSTGFFGMMILWWINVLLLRRIRQGRTTL